MPKIEFPSARDRRMVESMAALQMPIPKMCLILQDPNTNQSLSRARFSKLFAREIAVGRESTDVRVFQKLIDVIEFSDSDTARIQAIIFYLKTRVPGFNPADQHSHTVTNRTGVLVAPGSVEPTVWVEQQKIANDTKDAPEGGALDDLLA